MRPIDADEIMGDILDGEIEITGEGSKFARDAVESYRAVVLRRIMVQPTEKVIFANEIVDLIFGEDNRDAEAIVEVLCRKLNKLGLVELDGDKWKAV